ncbi:flagellar biosynthesis protein FlhF [Clostridium psychrophilum]|uniref:flagellar biosynthesis protein FlhF n=1 Tax=Clostridium psychrophilum TaxID=132926 RepID=UPI001C0C99AB|nr:flagellar biosynthesis protein FlhF [Clostridium psychrophilum]MBU3180629.1 flagellar biosynthesis protein FlhF [Clostridium psychrophilum]
MIIKRYIVKSMNEAMTRIRYELGSDAVIISQRKIRKPGLKGIFTKKVIEVTAATENKVDEQKKDVVSSFDAINKVVEHENKIKVNNRKLEESNKVVHRDATHAYEKGDNYSENIMNEMMKMKTMISNLASENKTCDSTKSDIEKILEDSDVDIETIKNIMIKVKDINLELTEYEKLKTVLKSMINVTSPKLEGRVVLAGPTGVGKTTTIAKLAGKLALVEKKKVGLITIDTYRIGAVEQLKTYADIMNIPFHVVYTMNDMEAAMESMSECEIILIDTTGRSSKNKMQIAELRTFVEKVHTENIHLVISATTKNKDLKYIIEGYQILHYNSIIVTKLDETSTYGSILNILNIAQIPLSFVSTGQNVPDDIKELSADKIVNLIVGEDTVC